MQRVSKVGILLPHFGPSQAAFYAIKEINKQVEKGLDGILFYENLVMPCLRPLCATMCINEVINFDGVLIVGNIHNMFSISKSVGAMKTVFYVWDLEWLRPGQNSFMRNISAYRAAHKVVCRSYEHARLVDNYSNRKVDAVEPDFNLDNIIGLF